MKTKVFTLKCSRVYLNIKSNCDTFLHVVLIISVFISLERMHQLIVHYTY